jgi:early secretory antigenic target protein ESAT-6
MSLVRVDYGVLESSQQQITGISRAIDQKLADLKQMLAKIEWVGTDQEAYNECQRRWDQSIADLNVVLGQIGGAVNIAKENYQATEASNRASFGG